MSYLQRAARRLASDGASDGGANVRPAIRSRSPLAEADQRLHLDPFAESFTTVVTGTTTAPGTGKAEPAAVSPPGRQQEERRPAPVLSFSAGRAPSARPAPPAGPAPPAQPREVRSEPTTTARAGERRRQAPPQRPTRPDTDVAQPAQHLAHGHPGTSAPLPASSGAAGRADAVPAPTVRGRRAPEPDGPRATSERVVGAAGSPAHDEVAQPILHALGRALSWVEGQPQPRPDPERSEGPTAVRPALRDSTATRPVRAMTPGPGPVTRLEIGKIEVEVVPPPKPVPPAAPARPAGTTKGTGSAHRQPFGWRQR